jgi:IS605 OrfB family transposase
MKGATMIITRKIQILPLTENKEEFINYYKILREYSYKSWKMATEIVNTYYLNTHLKNILKEKNLDKNIVKQIYNSKSEQNIAYIITKKYSEVPSYIRAGLANSVILQFQNDFIDVQKGNRTIRNYRRETFPIYFMISEIPIKFENNKYIFSLNQKLKFELFFGKDRSNNRCIIDRILTKEYKICDSQIKIIKNKIFILLTIKFENKKENRLDKNIIVGVDMGYSNFAYCGLNNGESRLVLGSNDSVDSIQSERKRIIYRKNNLQKLLKLTTGGKGRKRKLKFLNNFSEYESNFMKTKNHCISREIIKFALKNNAGIIQVEDLFGIKDNIDNSWLRQHWSYFQLQTMIEYKAKMEGIELKKINPAYTSKTCSKCGKINKDLLLEDRIFKYEKVN